MFAREWLKKIMSDNVLTERCPAKIIISAAQAVGIKRNELKAARKELGIKSIQIDGVQYWSLSEGEDDA